MKKLLLLSTVALLSTGIAFAHGGDKKDKACCKDKKECKKDDKACCKKNDKSKEDKKIVVKKAVAKA
jgi:hypothetical protein